ncbi:hypothetical protein NFI96_005596 [Prochilodus magdalenae]|nr:hypothetical protein NFI96_005596 [Prochilodus magdalenae]
MVTVKARPKPTVRVQPARHVFIGETATLTCDIEGGGGWQYQWSKDDNPLSDAREKEYKISKAGQSHRGVYTCRGTQSTEPRYSQTSNAVTLTVSEVGSGGRDGRAGPADPEAGQRQDPAARRVPSVTPALPYPTGLVSHEPGWLAKTQGNGAVSRTTAASKSGKTTVASSALRHDPSDANSSPAVKRENAGKRREAGRPRSGTPNAAPGSLQRHVRLSKVTTLSQAVEEAERAELILKDPRPASCYLVEAEVADEVRAARVHTAEASPRTLRCWRCKRRGHKASQCRATEPAGNENGTPQ